LKHHKSALYRERQFEKGREHDKPHSGNVGDW